MQLDTGTGYMRAHQAEQGSSSVKQEHALHVHNFRSAGGCFQAVGRTSFTSESQRLSCQVRVHESHNSGARLGQVRPRCCTAVALQAVALSAEGRDIRFLPLVTPSCLLLASP